MKESLKPDLTGSTRLANMIQFGGFPQNGADNELLQNFIRSNLQRETANDPNAETAGDNVSTNQEGRLNYIFNMLLNSVSNPEEANTSNTASNMNQSFGNQGSESREMNDN